MENTRDLHFPLRIRAKISEYAPILTFQIALSFQVNFHLALGQQRKKNSDFHQFTTDAEFGEFGDWTEISKKSEIFEKSEIFGFEKFRKNYFIFFLI